MVYLSQVALNPHARATGRVLADLYALHQFVYAAFAGAAPGEVGRVLFRLDTGVGSARSEPILLVQSERAPEWDRLSGQVCCVRGPKVWEPRFETGQRLRFRLRASPTKRVALPRDHPQRGNQRIGLVTRREQADWLSRQGERCGFALCDPPRDWFDAFEGSEPRQAVQIVSMDHLKGQKLSSVTGKSTTLTHLTADFDGLLRVTCPASLSAAVTAGIGPGKAFGLGLLSLARYD